MITLAERLVAARVAAGMTQKAVAEAVGFSQETIRDIEAGAFKGLNELLAIAEAVRVQPEWLISGSPERTAVAAVQASPSDPISTAIATLADIFSELDEADRSVVRLYLEVLMKDPHEVEQVTKRIRVILCQGRMHPLNEQPKITAPSGAD